MDMLELAKVAYNTYGKLSEFRTVNGDPMPKWEVLPDEMQQIWVGTVKVILEAGNAAILVPVADTEGVLPFDKIYPGEKWIGS